MYPYNLPPVVRIRIPAPDGGEPRSHPRHPAFASFPGRVAATNNACERDLRPAVIQRKNTNGYRAMWSAKGEAAVRTVVATARLTAGASTFDTVLSTIRA